MFRTFLPAFWRRVKWSALALLAPGTLLFLLVFLAPLAILAAYSFVQNAREFSLSQLTLQYYGKALGDPFYFGVLVDTVVLAGAISFLTLVIGYPLAYAIARSRSLYRGLLLALVIAPLLTNIMVRTLGWIIILGDHGVVNDFMIWLGILHEPIEFLGTHRAIVIALVHIFLPFLILPLVGAIENVDKNLEEAARTLGAGWLRTFVEVIVPLSMPGILVGCTLVFLLSMASLISPLVLGLGKVWVISTLIYQQIRVTNWSFAGALSFLLMTVTLLVILCSNMLGRRWARLDKRQSNVSTRSSRHAGASRTFRRKVRTLVDRFWQLIGALLIAQRPILGLGYLLPVYCALVYAFLLTPLAFVIRSAFDAQTILSGNFQSFTLQWFEGALTSETYLESLWLSLQLAGTAMCVSLVLGTLASLALVRYRFPGRNALGTLFLSPLTIPAVITGVALLIYFQYLGIGASFLRLLAAHVLIGTTYVVRSVSAALQGVDPVLEESAGTLGASPLKVFWKITLPLIRPGLFSAAIFAFLVSFDELTITLLVAGSRLFTLPLRIFAQLEQYWDPSVSALSTIMIGVTVLAVIALNRIVGLSKFQV